MLKNQELYARRQEAVAPGIANSVPVILRIKPDVVH